MYPQFTSEDLFIFFFSIAPLIREPGKVVSMGRALVPKQPNFNDRFTVIFSTGRLILLE
jgi:hypothetical protein